MKKSICLLFTGFGLILQLLAQSTTDNSLQSAFHSESDLASFNLSFSNKMGKRVWLGLGVGGGLSFVHGNFEAPFTNDWTKENYHFRVFISNPPQKKLHYELGVLSGQMFYDENFGKEFAGQRFSSGYIRLFYGWEQFKIGSQFAIGEIGAMDNTLWMWTPIMLRYSILGLSTKK